MRLTTISCLLAALASAYSVLAEAVPQPLPDVIEEQMHHLEPRQGAPVTATAATLGNEQAPTVTVYDLGTKLATYTQTFSTPVDQWPSPKAGTIGYGNGNQKRDAVPAQATVVETATQMVVLVMATEVVTQPLQRVTQVVVVQTMAVFSNRTVMGNDTAGAGNDTLPAAARGTGLFATGFRAAPTASR